jgi:hypothetical protein
MIVEVDGGERKKGVKVKQEGGLSGELQVRGKGADS